MTAAHAELLREIRLAMLEHGGLHGRDGMDLTDKLLVKITAALATPPSAEGWIAVPVEVWEFFRFAEAAFEPFTPQQEELKKSLKKATKAMRSSATKDKP